MKIQNIKSKQIETPISYPYIQEEKRTEIVQDQSQGTEATNSSLKEQILAIQKAKGLLGIKSLAASDLLDDGSASERIQTAKRLGEKASPTWNDFWRLANALSGERFKMMGSPSVAEAIASSLLEVANKITSEEFSREKIEDHAVILVDEHSHSGYRSRTLTGALESLIRGSYEVSTLTISRKVSRSASINAARAVRLIIEKGGENLIDEAGAIEALLESGIEDAREQGAIAALNSFQHKWRRNINETGLLVALKNEESDSIRSKVARAISNANPKSIVEVTNLNKWDKKSGFHPIILLSGDRSLEVKDALASGIEDLCLAQIKLGWYYKNFSEKPELNPQNRIDCFTFALSVLEQLTNSRSSIQEYQAKMLNRCCNIVSYLVSDEAIACVKSSGSKEQNDEYERLINKLSQLDLIKFIKLVSYAEFSDSGWKNVNAWSNASQTIDRILLSRTKNYDNPLRHYLKLKEEISQMKKEAQNTSLISKMESAIEKVNSAIVCYLAEVPIHNIEQINWTNELEFNLAVASLLEIFEHSQKDVAKLSIFNFFETINSKGLSLGSKRKLLDEALSDLNRSKLLQILKTTVHSSKDKAAELFLNPQPSTSQGKALLVYRAYKTTKTTGQYRSYKDYYGMDDLKQRALTSATEVIVSRKDSKGLLLSGEPGTGKSMFADVLANQVAIPIIKILSSEMKKENRYLEDIRNAGCCVVLIDEVEGIAPASEQNSKIFGFLNELQKLPVVVIATTNAPTTDTIEGMDINEDGTSPDIDGVLAQRVHPDCLKVMQPCYFFHRKSVGVDFTKQYLGILTGSGRLNTNLNLELVSTLGKGLTPLAVKDTIDIMFDPNGEELSIDKIISELGKQQLGRLIIMTTSEEQIRKPLKQLELEEAIKIEGPINYKKVAFLVEDTPPDRIEEVLNKAPSVVNEAGLLNLFVQHLGIDPQILQILEKF